ncbi:MAG: excinuclease ABC subunit UvrA [Bacteroidales bacterium]
MKNDNKDIIENKKIIAQKDIIIEGARENNLKNVSLKIPKYKISIFTGVSGSGKSSLVLDTIAAKSRRELNDTFPAFVQHYLPKYGRPNVDKIENLPIAIVIDQKKPQQNSRSTVGTYTDIYTLLRLLFSRVGKPFVGYSDSFSFNHPAGSCPRCGGLGEIRELDIHKLVDFNKSLNDENTIHYNAFGKGNWRWIRYAYSGFFDLDKKIKDYSPEKLDLFLNSPQIKPTHPHPRWPKSAKFEGIIPRMYRSIINSDEGIRNKKVLEPMLKMGVCPDCHGTRLNDKILSCKIRGKNIAEISKMSIHETNLWVQNNVNDPLGTDIKVALVNRLSALEEIGLSYISLERGIGTLSGGEAQRCKIAKYINSSLSDVLYILDEPSVGLHLHDINLLKKSVRKLRDHSNTVLMVEHHPEMMKIADHIIDMGPGAGQEGGNILFEGNFKSLLVSNTPTGKILREKPDFKPLRRNPVNWWKIQGANLHNLKNLDVKLPQSVFCVIAGVAGSGKSSLMEYFRNNFDTSLDSTDTTSICTTSISTTSKNLTSKDIIFISQKNIGISLRSTPATYLGVMDLIRKKFAKENGTKIDIFSFNGKGACPVCKGKGIIVADMAFMDSIETVCEACHGLRYSKEALAYTIKLPIPNKLNAHSTSTDNTIILNIAQVLDLTVRRASELFKGTKIEEKLRPLVLVGLQYLHLNQALSTLSGGELQRVKLASYLQDTNKLFILDEPTDGLHIKDIYHIIRLFDAIVDKGNSVFLIEHSLEVIKAADYIIELGPKGGNQGGYLLYAGDPKYMSKTPKSITGKYL